jgi:Calx-beta domain
MQSNSATLGTDFTATGGNLTFAAGVTSRTFVVNVTNDVLAEGNESGHLILSNPIGGITLGGRKRAMLTIVDNDASTSGFQFSKPSYTASENGSMPIVITRTTTTAAQSVTFTTSNNGTATAGADYTAVNTLVSFVSGRHRKR